MFEGEKTIIFWIGLIILGLASIGLFSIAWFSAVDFYTPPIELQVPFIVGAVVFILIGLYMMKSGKRQRKKGTAKEEAETNQPRKKMGLESNDYTALSAQLDFHSDRATAQAGFLVACVFGLFTVLSLIKGKNPVLDLIYSLTYGVLWAGGLWALFNFNFYATEADKIQHIMIESTVTHLKAVEASKYPLLLRIYQGIRFSRFMSKHKVTMMIIFYIFFIGVLPLFFTLVSHWTDLI